jgi:hypothetical protein
MEIAKAVGRTKEEVAEVVSQGKGDLERHIGSLIQSATNDVDQHMGESIRQIDMKATELQSIDSSARGFILEFYGILWKYMNWIGLREIRTLEKTLAENGTGSARELGRDLMQFAFAAHRIAGDSELRDLADFDDLALGLIKQGANGLLAGYTIPQENDFWYDNGSRAFKDLDRMLGEISRRPGTPQAQRHKKVAEIRGLIPNNPDKPSPQELEFLISRHKAIDDEAS